MYKEGITLEEVLKLPGIEKFKLCYIDSIDRTQYDYDEESQKIIDSSGFQWSDPSNYWRLRTVEIPNPEYIPGQQELYAYFTDIDMDNQWADDWDDAPYEHNAGRPYDAYYDENDKRIEGTIIQVLFAVRSFNYKLPLNYGHYGNSPFCVADINGGAVAWIYDNPTFKGTSKAVSIHAGINPIEFKKKLDKIAENNPDYVPYTGED